jgi:VIT1/CCC1 family predicted Fe2+/Mn2+ transporter
MTRNARSLILGLVVLAIALPNAVRGWSSHGDGAEPWLQLLAVLVGAAVLTGGVVYAIHRRGTAR